jgi:hypothetical protein
LHKQQSPEDINRIIPLAEATICMLDRSKDEILPFRLAAYLHEYGQWEYSDFKAQYSHALHPTSLLMMMVAPLQVDAVNPA